jgi:membrane protein required for colicin V production
MNILDYIILVPLLYLTIKGIIRGIIREIASLAGIILGIWLGMIYQEDLSAVLRDYLPDNRFIPILSIALIFILMVILANIAGWGLKSIFRKLFLGWIDRVMGGVFAVVKTIFIAYFVLVILTFYMPRNAPLISESVRAPWLLKSAQRIIGVVSPDDYINWKKMILGRREK